MDTLWWQVFASSLVAKTSLILLTALFLSWLSKRSTAHLRHLVLLSASMIVLLLPAISLFVPEWQLNWFTLVQSTSTAQHSTAYQGQQVDASEGVWAWWWVGIWFVGFLVVLGFLVVGRFLGWAVLRNAKPLTDQKLLGIVDTLSKRLGLSSRVPLLVTDRVKVPVIFGTLRGRLILPAQIGSWPEDRLEAILYHELAHVSRFDVLSQTLAQLACSLHWYNPLIWIVERRQMIERERACDSVVLRSGKKASEYARHLMDSASALALTKNPSWATAAMAEGTDFKDRLLSILDPNAPRTSKRRHLALLAPVCALVLLFGLAAAKPVTLIQQVESSPTQENPSGLFANPVMDALPQSAKRHESARSAKHHTGRDQDQIARDMIGGLFEGLAELAEADLREKNQSKQGQAIRKLIGSIGQIVQHADDEKKAKQSINQLFQSIGELVISADEP